MSECAIDYCERWDEKTLTVSADDVTVKLGLCGVHALALRDRIAFQLDVSPQFVNLSHFGGTFGELQDAINYLDELAAMDIEGRGH